MAMSVLGTDKRRARRVACGLALYSKGAVGVQGRVMTWAVSAMSAGIAERSDG